MNKAQRKAQLKEIKANQKAARKAANTPETPMKDRTFEVNASGAAVHALIADCEVKQAEATLSTLRARQLMAQAAESIGRVIEFAEAALKAADPSEVLAARAIMAGEDDAPRRGPNPVVALLNLLVRAKSLLPRILKVTNPELFAPPAKHAA